MQAARLNRATGNNSTVGHRPALVWLATMVEPIGSTRAASTKSICLHCKVEELLRQRAFATIELLLP